MGENATTAKQNGAWPWRPFLSNYRNEEIRALTFESKEATHKAIDFMYDKLYGMPFGLPGYHSLVIPQEAVHFFSEAGFTFEESALLTEDDLTPEELEEYRNRRR